MAQSPNSSTTMSHGVVASRRSPGPFKFGCGTKDGAAMPPTFLPQTRTKQPNAESRPQGSRAEHQLAPIAGEEPLAVVGISRHIAFEKRSTNGGLASVMQSIGSR